MNISTQNSPPTIRNNFSTNTIHNNIQPIKHPVPTTPQQKDCCLIACLKAISYCLCHCSCPPKTQNENQSNNTTKTALDDAPTATNEELQAIVQSEIIQNQLDVHRPTVVGETLSFVNSNKTPNPNTTTSGNVYYV